MAQEDKINPSTTLSDQKDQKHEVSRRDVLTGAGVVAGVVTALSATSLSTPSASAVPEDDSGPIGIDKPGVNAGEFRSWIVQSGTNGENFVSYGFLTKVSGATDLDLFDDPLHDETSALMTIYAEGTLQQRVFGQNVHTLDVEGTLVIYQRHTGGASASDPNSFKIGTPVAQFALTLQDVLTVFAPGSGLPTLTGDMRQTGVGRVVGIGKSAHARGGTPFGKLGMRARLFATGLGTRPNPATFNTLEEMSGNWTVEQQ